MSKKKTVYLWVNNDEAIVSFSKPGKDDARECLNPSKGWEFEFQSNSKPWSALCLAGIKPFLGVLKPHHVYKLTVEIDRGEEYEWFVEMER